MVITHYYYDVCGCHDVFPAFVGMMATNIYTVDRWSGCALSIYLFHFVDRSAGMCTNTLVGSMRNSSPGSWSIGESGVPLTTSPAHDVSRWVRMLESCVQVAVMGLFVFSIAVATDVEHKA